ncbi:MAG: hypothetical protein MZV64_30815 [Ignavibacteriales bacterium]|nr:hypothetical protein [Ignavibacteriales bacterium]
MHAEARAPRSWRRRPRRARTARARRRPAVRAATGCRAARPTRRTRPCPRARRCAGSEATPPGDSTLSVGDACQSMTPVSRRRLSSRRTHVQSVGHPASW